MILRRPVVLSLDFILFAQLEISVKCLFSPEPRDNQVLTLKCDFSRGTGNAGLYTKLTPESKTRVSILVERNSSSVAIIQDLSFKLYKSLLY